MRHNRFQVNPQKWNQNFIKTQQDKEIWQLVSQTFDAFDANKSGQLDEAELRNLLNFGMSRGIIKQSHQNQFIQYVKQIDVNKDGLVSKRELFHFIKGTPISSVITVTHERSRSKERKKIFIQPNVGSHITAHSPGRFIPSPRVSPSKQLFDQNNRKPSPNKSNVNKNPYPYYQIFNNQIQIEEEVQRIFRRYDTNRSGSLDFRELISFLQNEINNKFNYFQFMNMADTNKSGTVNPKELKQFFIKYGKK